MPNQRDGIMRFRLFKKTPTVHLIKRKGGLPSPKPQALFLDLLSATANSYGAALTRV
jgi:hypothetical protein